MHASDSGYQRYINEWEGVRDNEFTPFGAQSGFTQIVIGQHREIMDTVASAIGHGLCTRFPRLKIAPIENGSGWVSGLLDDMARAYRSNPQGWEEHPVEVFKRNIFIHPFHEDDPVGLVDLLGPDNVLFGSDYPHPEGMVDPITFVDDLAGLPGDQIAKVMGGNLSHLMNLAALPDRG
jgi:predicted TIM-barrel fold metal-dependent hydrolase